MKSTKGISVRLSKFLQNQLHLKDGGHRHIAPIANVKMAKDDIAKDLRSIRALDFFLANFFLCQKWEFAGRESIVNGFNKLRRNLYIDSYRTDLDTSESFLLTLSAHCYLHLFVFRKVLDFLKFDIQFL